MFPLIIFVLGVASLLYAFFKEEQNQTEVAKHKVIIEQRALDKFQRLETLFVNHQITLKLCNEKYDAIIKLSEQVNQDCNKIESSVEKLEKRQTVLNNNQKILSKRQEMMKEILAQKKVEVTVEYIDNRKTKASGATK